MMFNMVDVFMPIVEYLDLKQMARGFSRNEVLEAKWLMIAEWLRLFEKVWSLGHGVLFTTQSQSPEARSAC